MSGRKIIMALTAGVLWAGAVALASGLPSKMRPLGFVTSQGDVQVDHRPVPSGTAVFSGEVITTGRSSAASLKLLSGAQATLGEDGELTMSDGKSAAPILLTRGAVALRNPGTDAALVNVGATTVVIKGEQGFPAICRVAYLRGETSVFADGGHVEVHRYGMSSRVLPGKSLRLGAGMPQAAGQMAGKVSNLIPQGTVQHPAQTTQVSLNINDPIVWEDTVRTLNTGRVRIGLNDGSFLNVGVRSTMRIVKHDAQSQQTEIEMQLGKLRGQVVKLSKPGSSFQVKTQTAVIGVVGTVFVVTATPKNTNVLCVEGKVNVKNVDPNIPGDKTLGPGEQANVPAGQPPSAPVFAGPGETPQQLNATNAGEFPSPELAKFGEIKFPGGATLPAPGVPRGAPSGLSALHIGSLAAAGASAAVGGVAVAGTSNAQDQAAAAAAEASQAGQSAGAASDAAGNAANAANSFQQGVQNYIDSLSPGGGGCGCLP
jgi:hypothetical protein